MSNVASSSSSSVASASRRQLRNPGPVQFHALSDPSTESGFKPLRLEDGSIVYRRDLKGYRDPATGEPIYEYEVPQGKQGVNRYTAKDKDRPARLMADYSTICQAGDAACNAIDKQLHDKAQELQRCVAARTALNERIAEIRRFARDAAREKSAIIQDINAQLAMLPTEEF